MAVAAPDRTLPRTRWAVAACGLLALALRAPFLSLALGRDEGGVAFIARQWPGGHGSLYGAYWLDRPPLLVALYKLAGGDLGVRALGAGAAVALVLSVWRLARAVGGEEAGRVAAVMAALLSGSYAIGAVQTPAELLAAVPSTLSVLCLVRGRLFAAGLLAAGALLVKQSFIDAGVAGLAFLILARRPRWWLRYGAGLALPLVPLAAGGFTYALVGFRLQALGALAGSSLPLQDRLGQLAGPALGSGLVVALPAAIAGIARARNRVLAAWLAGGLAGVLAGGSYWPHYLIELVPVTCVGVALLRPPRMVVAAFAAVSVAAAISGAGYVHAHPPYRTTRAAARYVRTHARPGDTEYVLYARANLLHYAGLPTPYPYLWSLMLRAKPGAVPRLRRLLASPGRPTWVVEWQPPDAWGLDPHGATARLLRHDYRRVATIDGHPVLHAR